MSEETQQITNQDPKQATHWMEYFTTVTPLSKFLAMMMFVFLPFLGFWAGTRYASTLEPQMPLASSEERPTQSPKIADDSVSYRNEAWGLEFIYPKNITLQDGTHALAIREFDRGATGQDFEAGLCIEMEGVEMPACVSLTPKLPHQTVGGYGVCEGVQDAKQIRWGNVMGTLCTPEDSLAPIVSVTTSTYVYFFGGKEGAASWERGGISDSLIFN